MAAFRETITTPEEFAFGNGRVTFFAAQRGKRKRWYISRVSGGNVTDDASYASRRSARRAVKARIAREGGTIR